MTWNGILGIAASISFFLPVAAILYYKLYKHRSLAALLLAYVMTALYNLLLQNIIPASDAIKEGYGVITKYADIPLMLTALLFFCPIKQKQRSVHIVTAIFIAYEIVIAVLFGVSPNAVVYIMGPGLALILIYTFYLFSRHIKLTIEYGKNAGRTLMLVSILLAYGCYTFMYYFYYIKKTPYVGDVFLLYFIVSVIASGLMAAGLHLIRKRMKELQEIKNTRRELALFFEN